MRQSTIILQIRTLVLSTRRGEVDYMTKDFRTLQRYGKLVPFELTHIVCVCTEHEQQQAWNSGKKKGDPLILPGLTRCNNCNKYPRYMLRTCAQCGTRYVDSFNHPNKCIKFPQCWDCVNSVPIEACMHPVCQAYHEYIPPRPEDLTKREKVKAEDIKFDFSIFDDEDTLSF